MVYTILSKVYLAFKDENRLKERHLKKSFFILLDILIDLIMTLNAFKWLKCCTKQTQALTFCYC